MTHLKIEQDGITEEVTSSVISKLYEIASTGTLDNTSDLKGRLHSIAARDIHVTYLNANYPDLHISADKLYITFEDAEVDRILTQKFGDGVGVTEIDMLGVSGINTGTGFDSNTTIQTFNELGRFSTIKTLYTYAFNACTNLTSIDLSNIEYVGGQAFSFTNLTGIINLPNVIQIGNSERGRAFYNCIGITEVNIGDKFQSFVNDSHFANCSGLQKVSMEAKCPDIPTGVFDHCTALSTFDVDMSEVENIWHSAFGNCSSLTTLDLSHVKYFGYQSLFKSGLTGVIDLPSVIGFRASNGTLGQYGMSGAFSYCTGITEVNMGPNLQYFDTVAIFKGDTSLTKVTGLSGITYLPPSTFSGCTSFTTTDINWSNITEIGAEALRDCPIQLSLDLSNINVGQQAFDGTTNVTITGFPRVQEYGFRWFQNIKAQTSITIPKEVQTCGNYTFAYNRNLQNITFENGFQLTELPYGMFCNSVSLQSITLPEGIIIIGQNLCDSDTSLTYVDIPSTVTTIRDNAFLFCPLSTVICRATTPPTLGTRVFNGTCTIYVSDASVNAYKAAANWSTYASQIVGISQLPS